MTVFARLACFWAGMGVVVGVMGTAVGERLGVDLAERPDGVGLGVFDVCVVRGDARLDLEALRVVRTEVLGMIHVRDVAAGSEAERRAQELGVPLLETGKPGTARMDVRHPGWMTVVARVLAKEAAERGFHGFVLDGLNTLKGDDERAAGLEAVAVLRGMFPEKKLVLKDSPELADAAGRHLDGVLITSGREVETQVRQAMRMGLKAYVMEIASEKDGEKIAERAREIEALGGVPFFTTNAEGGANLGPMREVTRRVVVLHSGKAGESFTATVLHGSLQWLGCEVIYREYKGEATTGLGLAGVILDESLRLNAREQESLAALVRDTVEQKVPLLITGMPWDRAERVADVLGWEGSGDRVEVKERLSFAKLEGAALEQNGMVTPRAEDVRDLRAPANARVLMSLRVGKNRQAAFDSAYLADWGAAWFDPQAPTAGPQISPMFLLESWLGPVTEAPVMDVTCQGGKRLMVTHIGSEGFTEISSVKGLPLAAEAMLERVLTRHEIPCTVALCEGDLRGWTPASDAREVLRYAQAARSILALPHVEAAAGSMSRPNNWDGKRFEPGPLKTKSAEARPGLEREIAGSLSYIHRQFLPVGKMVAVMLWPGQTAPGTEAVAFARKMGVESFEGAAPAEKSGPPAISWGRGSELRVVAALGQPERRLNAAEMIAEYERTGMGAWQSPVDVGLSFADALSERSLGEVEKILKWCQEQPLHAITAGEHARMVTDAAQTRIYEAGPRHWVLVNRGRAQTLRLPASAGVPDLERSFGIASYAVRGGCLYVQTLGRRRTELVMKLETRAAQPISAIHEKLH